MTSVSWLISPPPRRETVVFNLKAGIYLKMSGKSDFLFSLELASSAIGLHIGKSSLGVFSKFYFERAFTYERCMNCSSLPWQQKLLFF